ETHNVVLDEEYARSRQDVEAGEYVLLTVSDTGSGMSEEVKSHLFEPFYTTKERGKGTGLGLATSYGIAKQAGGHIAVYSELGAGTTMRVYLPSVADAVESEPARRAAARGGDETILLVEDEAAVRNVASKILGARGYRIVEAGDADEALGVLERNSAEIDLVFTDVVLPRMGGRELAEKALEMRPGIKGLLASGYTDDIVLHRRLMEHGVALLQKPYTSESLCLKVRETLDAA